VKSALYLAVGQAMIATFEGTAFHVSYALASVVGIIIEAVIMLRINIFSRAAAYALMVGDVIGLGLYIPAIGIFLSVISVPVLWACRGKPVGLRHARSLPLAPGFCTVNVSSIAVRSSLRL
jgi:hypothetical protein